MTIFSGLLIIALVLGFVGYSIEVKLDRIADILRAQALSAADVRMQKEERSDVD